MARPQPQAGLEEVASEGGAWGEHRRCLPRWSPVPRQLPDEAPQGQLWGPLVPSVFLLKKLLETFVNKDLPHFLSPSLPREEGHPSAQPGPGVRARVGVCSCLQVTEECSLCSWDIAPRLELGRCLTWGEIAFPLFSAFMEVRVERCPLRSDSHQCLPRVSAAPRSLITTSSFHSLPGSSGPGF